MMLWWHHVAPWAAPADRRAPGDWVDVDAIATAAETAAAIGALPATRAASPPLNTSPAPAVADHATDDDAASALADLLVEAVDALRDDPRDAKRHRALATTFFHDVPTQEAAAERLGLAFSTYRRHLAAGIDRVTDWLWERELHGTATS